MANFKINPYKKKSGEWMLYVNKFNPGNTVSLGIADRVYTSKLTKGQDKLLDLFLKAIRETEPLCDFDMNQPHKEIKSNLDFKITMYITDIAQVGSVKVEEDGLYLAKENKLYSADSIIKTMESIAE